jgi:hypothetical protein
VEGCTQNDFSFSAAGFAVGSRSMEALGDFFRFWWELLVLNARKSLARARGLPPPCQAPGDSGRARETTCEACLQWNKIGRFRRVCPSLTWTDAGWKCGVDAAAVRPFWGRACAAYGGLAAGLFLVATLGAFGGLRAVGYRVSYRDVAWPPAWKRIDRARAEFYAEKGQAALTAGRINESGLDLSLAWQLDPTNTDVGLALAQLWQAGQPSLSDRIYQRLLTTQPARSAEIARAWAQALLLRGDFAELGALAEARLAAGQGSGWLQALVFSARRLGDAGPLRVAQALPNISAETRTLLGWEATSVAGAPDAARAGLMAPLGSDASDYARYHQIAFLSGNGAARRALELLAAYGAKVPPSERVALTLRALGALDTAEARARLTQEFTALLAGNTTPAIHELLAAELIRRPDPARLRLATDALVARSWTNRPEGTPALAALLCAAAVARDAPQVALLRTYLRRATGGKLVLLDRAEEILGTRASGQAAGNFLAQLPMLPREAAYAVHARVASR